MEELKEKGMELLQKISEFPKEQQATAVMVTTAYIDGLATSKMMPQTGTDKTA